MNLRKRINIPDKELSCSACKTVNGKVKNDKGQTSRNRTVPAKKNPRTRVSDLSDAEKYRLNRIKNNEYSKRSREKRVAYEKSKRDEEMHLEEKNCTLWNEHNTLRKQVDLLKGEIDIILKNCKNCSSKFSPQSVGSHSKNL